jgi:hypothetical protein
MRRGGLPRTDTTRPVDPPEEAGQGALDFIGWAHANDATSEIGHFAILPSLSSLSFVLRRKKEDERLHMDPLLASTKNAPRESVPLSSQVSMR